jgi:hypothetical protein
MNPEAGAKFCAFPAFWQDGRLAWAADPNVVARLASPQHAHDDGHRGGVEDAAHEKLKLVAEDAQFNRLLKPRHTASRKSYCAVAR